jgi:hypothetical protein
MQNLVTVILESPYSGPSFHAIDANVKYARLAVKDCLRRGESPIASHLLLTQIGILDDASPEDRTLGIDAGHAWFGGATKMVVYTDRGISSGMQLGTDRASLAGLPVERRSIDGYAPTLIPEAMNQEATDELADRVHACLRGQSKSILNDAHCFARVVLDYLMLIKNHRAAIDNLGYVQARSTELITSERAMRAALKSLVIAVEDDVSGMRLPEVMGAARKMLGWKEEE